MQDQTCLKRNKLAQSLRMGQRERIKKQMREKFTHTIQETTRQWSDEHFRKLKHDCRQSNFTRQTVHSALEYMFAMDLLQGFGQEINLKFLDELTCKVEGLDHEIAKWARNGIKEKLMQLVELELAQSSKDDKGNIYPSVELAELSVLKDCFDGFLFLVENNRCYSQLWIAISQLRNHQLKNYSFLNLQQYITKNMQRLESQQITIISLSLYNYLEDCPSQIHKFLALIDTLFLKYNIRPCDAIRLIDTLICIVSGECVESKIKVIVEDTFIVQNVTSFMDKSNPQASKNGFQLVGKVAEFVAKLYSVDDEELCTKVYMCNIMILGHIRSWLPLPPNIQVHMLEHLGSGSLLHSNHKCTMYLIFALTNIVVSDPGYIQTILIKSDIYRCLISMYKLVPLGCRQQIAIFIRNIVYKSDTGSLRIMLQTKLPEILTEMLKETNSSITTCALKAMHVVFCLLEEEGTVMSQFLFTKKRFQDYMQNLGAVKIVESLVHSPEQELADSALIALDHIV